MAAARPAPSVRHQDQPRHSRGRGRAAGAGGTDSGRDRMRAAMAVQTCSGGACGGRARASGSSRSSQSRTRWRSAASSRSRPANRRRAPRAARRPRNPRPGGLADRGRCSSFHAPLEPLQAAADPALYRSQRRVQARRDVGMRQVVEERHRDGDALRAVQLAHAAGQAVAFPAGRQAGQRARESSAKASVSASSGSGSSRPGRRRRSMQRLRTMRVIQVMGWLWSGRYCPACRQIERKHSCSTSSAAAGSLNIRLASAYRCGDARRYSSSSADSRWRAHCASKACSGWASVIVSLEQDEAGYSIPARRAPVTLRVTLFPRTTMAAMSGPRIAARPV